MGKKRNPMSNDTMEKMPVSSANLASSLYHQYDTVSPKFESPPFCNLTFGSSTHGEHYSPHQRLLFCVQQGVGLQRSPSSCWSSHGTCWHNYVTFTQLWPFRACLGLTRPKVRPVVLGTSTTSFLKLPTWNILNPKLMARVLRDINMSWFLLIKTPLQYFSQFCHS